MCKLSESQRIMFVVFFFFYNHYEDVKIKLLKATKSIATGIDIFMSNKNKKKKQINKANAYNL